MTGAYCKPFGCVALSLSLLISSFLWAVVSQLFFPLFYSPVLVMLSGGRCHVYRACFVLRIGEFLIASFGFLLCGGLPLGTLGHLWVFLHLAPYPWLTGARSCNKCLVLASEALFLVCNFCRRDPHSNSRLAVSPYLSVLSVFFFSNHFLADPWGLCVIFFKGEHSTCHVDLERHLVTCDSFSSVLDHVQLPFLSFPRSFVAVDCTWCLTPFSPVRTFSP